MKYISRALTFRKNEFYLKSSSTLVDKRRLNKSRRFKKSFKRFVQHKLPFVYKPRNLGIVKHQSFRQHRKKRISKKLLRFKKKTKYTKKLFNSSILKYLNLKLKKNNSKIVTLSSIPKPASSRK
jgi:hypothetical protein